MGRNPVVHRLVVGLSVPLAFLGLAVLWTFPLAAHLTTSIPGTGPGDNVTFLWDFWWMRTAEAEAGARFFWCPYLFAPTGTSLVLHTHLAAPAAVGVALGAFSVQVTLNALLILAVALNGYVAYLLAQEYTSAGPSILAGVVFGGAPAIVGRLAGHFNLVNAWMPALFALTWIRLARGRRISTALASAGALALVAYTDYYYLIYCLVFALAWIVFSFWTFRVTRVTLPPVLGRLRRLAGVLALGCLGVMVFVWTTGGATFRLSGAILSVQTVANPATAFWALLLLWMVLAHPFTIQVSSRGEREVPRTVGVAALALGGCGLLMVPMLIEAVRLVAAGDYVSQPFFWRSSPRGIDIGTLLLGNPHHPLYGAFVTRLYDRLGIDVLEQGAWLGVVPTALAVLALRRWKHLTPEVRRWVVVGVLFSLWSLGPFLVLFGQNTHAVLPQAAQRLVPILDNVRIPGRAIVFVQLALAIVAAVSVSRLRRARRWLPWLASACVIVDFLGAPIPLYRLPAPTRVEAYLAALNKDAVVCELPLGIRDGFGMIGLFDHRALYYQTFHRKPLVGGFVARLSPRIVRTYQQEKILRTLMELSSGEGGVPSRDALESLADELYGAGVRFVVVNGDSCPSILADAVSRSPGLQAVVSDKGRSLYRVISGHPTR